MTGRSRHAPHSPSSKSLLKESRRLGRLRLDVAIHSGGDLNRRCSLTAVPSVRLYTRQCIRLMRRTDSSTPMAFALSILMTGEEAMSTPLPMVTAQVHTYHNLGIRAQCSIAKPQSMPKKGRESMSIVPLEINLMP